MLAAGTLGGGGGAASAMASASLPRSTQRPNCTKMRDGASACSNRCVLVVQNSTALELISLPSKAEEKGVTYLLVVIHLAGIIQSCLFHFLPPAKLYQGKAERSRERMGGGVMQLSTRTQSSTHQAPSSSSPPLLCLLAFVILPFQHDTQV